ncbi:MAG TPA: hypothetical protein VEW47_11530 [Candidatus Dormibacteraeota bacterium]|nr:hypothetical protein [Candidatus Dormibacteraeota bacterium]
MPLRRRKGRVEAWFLERAPWTAAFLAVLASMPGLWLPFLSDDWAQIEAVGRCPVARTPFGDFRPLYMTTLWLDRRIGGLSPSLFHLTNLLWIAATAALVVILARRYTGDVPLALATGSIFALHPYHVENAAWIAARSDPVYAVAFLLAALSYDRWRVKASGLPLLALLSFEASLLAKESAVTLPLFVLLVGLVDPARRPGRGEWWRGYATLMLVACAHFLLFRPWVLGGAGRTLKEGFGPGWAKNWLGLGVASILPVHVEVLAARPVLYGALALCVLALLLLLVRLRAERIPPAALAAAAIFGVLLLPGVVGFQERYLFLPVAAASLSLATLVRAARGRWSVLLFSLLVAGWAWGCLVQWTAWQDAAIASRRLVGDLLHASLDGRTREIVIANAPFRVHGGSVAGDLQAAVRLSGGRPVPVRCLAYVSYPTPDSDFLDGPAPVSIRRPPPYAEVVLRVREGPFSHFIGPRPLEGDWLAQREGSIAFGANGAVRIRILADTAGGRAGYAWIGGHLAPLFGADEEPPGR